MGTGISRPKTEDLLLPMWADIMYTVKGMDRTKRQEKRVCYRFFAGERGYFFLPCTLELSWLWPLELQNLGKQPYTIFHNPPSRLNDKISTPGSQAS